MWGCEVCAKAYYLVGREELKKLGPLSRNEKITAGALAVTVGLWIFGGQVGVNAVAAALLGLAIMLITNVVCPSMFHLCEVTP